MDLDGLDGDNEQSEGELNLYEAVKEFSNGPALLELFGGSGSGKTVFALEIMKDALANGDVDALFVDAEHNAGDMSGLEDADYVYVPDWHDLYGYLTQKPSHISDNAFGTNDPGQKTLPSGYDVILVDSIGFPALVQYADYRVDDNADQFKVFLQIQAITGNLMKYSQRNDCMVIVTNQPKSDLSGSDDPAPFGDKSIYGFKEVWKTQQQSSNATATRCSINAWRSRQAGAGKTLYDMKISDEGVEVTVPDEEEGGGWAV